MKVQTANSVTPPKATAVVSPTSVCSLGGTQMSSFFQVFLVANQTMNQIYTPQQQGGGGGGGVSQEDNIIINDLPNGERSV